MNNLTQITTNQLIKELIRRKLIEITRYPLRINITTELINELRKNEDWEKWLNPKCRACGKGMASGDLCWDCSEKFKKVKNFKNHD